VVTGGPVFFFFFFFFFSPFSSFKITHHGRPGLGLTDKHADKKDTDDAD